MKPNQKSSFNRAPAPSPRLPDRAGEEGEKKAVGNMIERPCKGHIKSFYFLRKVLGWQ